MKKKAALENKSFQEVWKKKYGFPAKNYEPELLKFLQHKSVRQFSKKSISEKKMQSLFAAAQSASSSANLQLWSAVSVQTSAARNKLAKACGNQKQIKTCSWFFVFLADHYRMNVVAKKQGVKAEALKLTEFYTMAAIDAAIAAERMACAAESLNLGICYIGAIRNNPAKVKSILKLPEKTFALFGMCIGVPSRYDAGDIKPRLGQEAVWSREIYNRSPNISEYEARTASYYSKVRAIQTNWSKLSSKRVAGLSADPRANQKKWLKSQGFDLD